MQCTDGNLWCWCRLVDELHQPSVWELFPTFFKRLLNEWRPHPQTYYFFLVNFLQYFIVRVLEEWYSAAIPHKRRWAQQWFHGTDCPHLCSQQRGTKPGTSTVRTKPQMITWTVAVISLWLSSWKLINRVSEARWSVCLPPASHLKNDNRAQQMFYNHRSLTNALVRNQKIINYKKQTLLKLIDCQTSICWNVKINGYNKKLMNKSFSMLILSWMYYHKIVFSFRRTGN